MEEFETICWACRMLYVTQVSGDILTCDPCLDKGRRRPVVVLDRDPNGKVWFYWKRGKAKA